MMILSKNCFLPVISMGYGFVLAFILLKPIGTGENWVYALCQLDALEGLHCYLGDCKLFW